jgi:hypothetical protein
MSRESARALTLQPPVDFSTASLHPTSNDIGTPPTITSASCVQRLVPTPEARDRLPPLANNTRQARTARRDLARASCEVGCRRNNEQLEDECARSVSSRLNSGPSYNPGNVAACPKRGRRPGTSGNVHYTTTSSVLRAEGQIIPWWGLGLPRLCR